MAYGCLHGHSGKLHYLGVLVVLGCCAYLAKVFTTQIPDIGFNLDCYDRKVNPQSPAAGELPPDHCDARPRQFKKFIWVLIDSFPTSELWNIMQGDQRLMAATAYALRRSADIQYSYNLVPSLFDGHYPLEFRSGEIKTDNLVDQWGKASNDHLWLVAWADDLCWNSFPGNGGRNGGFEQRFYMQSYDEYPICERFWEPWYDSCCDAPSTTSNLLEKLNASEHKPSLLYYTFAYDHLYHGNSHTPETDQIVKEFKGNLPILLDWIDAHPEYVLIINSDHGHKRATDDPLHGNPGNMQPGNDASELFYHKSLIKRAYPNGWKDFPVLQQQDGCPTLARYIDGVNIPLGNVGSLAEQEYIGESGDFYGLYVNCIQLTHHANEMKDVLDFSTWSQIGYKHCRGGVALEHFGPAKRPADIDSWTSNVETYMDMVQAALLDIQRDGKYLPSETRSLGVLVTVVLMPAMFYYYVLSLRPIPQSFPQFGSNGSLRIAGWVMTALLGVIFLVTDPLYFAFEPRNKGSNLDFNNWIPMLLTMSFGVCAAAVLGSQGDEGVSVATPFMNGLVACPSWYFVAAFCINVVWCSMVGIAKVLQFDVNADTLHKIGTVPDRVWALFVVVPMHILYQHLIASGQDHKTIRWLKTSSVAIQCAALAVGDFVAWSATEETAASVWMFRVFLAMWFIQFVHSIIAPTFRSELAFAFFWLNVAFARTFDRRLALMVCALPAATLLIKGVRHSPRMYPILWLGIAQAYLTFRLLGHRWDIDADVTVSEVGQFSSAPIRFLQLLALLMERGGPFLGSACFFLAAPSKTTWDQTCEQTCKLQHEWKRAGEHIILARLAGVTAACGVYAARLMAGVHGGVLMLAESAATYALFLLLDFLIQLTDRLRENFCPHRIHEGPIKTPMISTEPPAVSVRSVVSGISDERLRRASAEV